MWRSYAIILNFGSGGKGILLHGITRGGDGAKVTEREAGELLLDFPKRWDGLREMREQRQAILEENKSAAAYDGSRMGQGGHSDQTGKKAGRLAELGGQDAVLLEAIRNWLSVGMMDQKDWVILTDLWRGANIQAIIKRRKCWDIGLRWQRMTRQLVRFVGDACGEHGAACVSIQQKSRRG